MCLAIVCMEAGLSQIQLQTKLFLAHVQDITPTFLYGNFYTVTIFFNQRLQQGGKHHVFVPSSVVSNEWNIDWNGMD